MARDRRWDFLYDRQKQPVKEYVLARFAEELARELQAWPPPFVEWVSEELRARWADGAVERPRGDVIRLALEISRLDLRREYDAIEAVLDREDHRLQAPAERSALHLLVALVTEKCLALKEHADGAHLTREDLAGALDTVERGLFRVTLG